MGGLQDVTPPDTTIASVVWLGPTDLVEPNSIRFELAGTDDGTAWFELEFECSLDGGPWEGCDRPYHYLPLEDLPGGQHELLVRAMDDFENVDPTPASYVFTTEAPPETTILTTPLEETGDTFARFTFGATPSAGATFECSLDLAPFTTCSNPLLLTDVPFGEHELEVRAKGPMGAVDQTPAAFSWASGDVTPPVITIHSGPAVATLLTTATFTFSVNDPDARLRCSLDGVAFDWCESPVTYTEADLALGNGHASGPHTFEVTAEKPNLLVESLPAVWEWTVDDISAPTTTIESGPPAEINADLPSIFTFSSNETGVTFECALDPLAVPDWSECASAPENLAEFTSMLPGAHVLLVRAVDPALNVDATPAEYRWTVVGPAITTITGDVPRDPLTTTATEATFSWTADQTGVTFMCSFDGAEFAPCTSPVSLPDVPVGSHTFEVQSTNRFLHVEEPPAVFEWTVEVPVDVELPETTIDIAPLDPATSSTATFEFSADQFNATFECSLDLALFVECTSPAVYTDVAEGDHVFAVRAVHAQVGIPDQSPAEHEWTVDLVPETTIDSGPPSQTLNPIALFTFSSNEADVDFQCALDGIVFNSCPGDGQFRDLVVATHVLRVRAVDSSGNIDPTPAVHRWTVGPMPDTFIVSGPDEIHPDADATFEFSSNLPGVRFECALDEMVEDLFFIPCGTPWTFEDLVVRRARAAGPRGRRRREHRSGPGRVELGERWRPAARPDRSPVRTSPPATGALGSSSPPPDRTCSSAPSTARTSSRASLARPTTGCRSARTSSRSRS